MILDKIENASKYVGLVPDIEKVLADFKDISNWNTNDKYHFDWGYLFFQQGTTKPIDEGQYELHRKYIDLQLVIKGSEYFCWIDEDNLTPVNEYSLEKDVQKFEGEDDHFVKINQDMFYICFPWDAHKAVVHPEEPTEYTKVVMKIKILEENNNE